MNVTQTEKDNLYKGLGLFIEAMRLYVVTLLQEKNKHNWARAFAESLYDDQKNLWKTHIENGKTPESLIDFGNLKSFAIKNKDLLKRDFGGKTGKLGTWFDEIREVRNAVAHHDNDIEQNDALKTWIHLQTIANILKMTELEAEIVKLKENKTAAEVKNVVSTNENETSLSPQSKIQNPKSTMPWFRNITPHLDIRQGRLDESVFAANLAEVALGTGREIYANPILFFEKTFFTSGLKSIAKTVIKGLNGQEDAENRVMSLQTGFGGGKTHTLISLFHLAKLGKTAANSESVKELIEATDTPEFDGANIAVFTNTTNDAANGRMTADGVYIQTIWGELAFQLGGREAFEIIRKNDEQLISPAGLFKKVLEKAKPALILIDELADYCIKASARKVGNSTLADQTISFMQELTEAVAGTNNCVAIITLPASPQEVGNTAQAHSILSTLESRVRRIGADTKPVADEEIYEVIRRRLFEDIGDAAQIEAVASKYMQMFQENWMEMPAHATKSEYKEKIKKSFPFHPELIDVFRIRWASSHDFQRTRGVLRLLAAIISDLWKRQNSLSGANLLIDAGDVNFANLDALSGQLKRLYGNGFDAVITADVSGSTSNAFKIDSERTEYGKHCLAESISSVILMNSFGTDGANRGVSIKDIKLNLLEPDSINHNLINSALDELEAAGYYLYYAQSGVDKRFWFQTKPNINILINQAKTDINNADIEAEILKRINEKSRHVQPFNILVHPTGDVPEQQKLTLIVLNPKFHADENGIAENTRKYIEQVATKKGSSERIYRNTILFLGVTNYGLTQLTIAVKEYLACRKISEDYNSQLERDQKEELRKKIEDENKKTETALVNAYSTVLKYSVKNGFQMTTVKQFRETFDGQINNNVFDTLKTEEWLLDSVGLGTLRSNNLLPTIEQSVKVKDIYEAFIRYDDKPMITNPKAIQRSLLKYCMEGAFCIAFGEDNKFTKYYFKENVPFLDINDINYWLIEKSLKPAPIPVPTNEPAPVQETTTFGEKIEINLPAGAADSVKQFKSITVSGNLPIDQFTASFNYFIAPFAMIGNKIEVQVSFKIISPESNLLTDSSQQYKSAKEAAKQLGLILTEDKS